MSRPRLLVKQIDRPDAGRDLYLAARTGKLPLLERALANGVDINQDCGDGRTALCHAIFRGHEGMVRALLEKGASASVLDEDGLNVVRRTLEEAESLPHYSGMRNLLLELVPEVCQPEFVTYDIDEILRGDDPLRVVDQLTTILSRGGLTLRKYEVSFLYAQRAKMQILNDGLQAWLNSTYGAGIAEARKGLEQIGAAKSATVIGKVLQLFPEGNPPLDIQHYTESLRAIVETKGGLIKQLSSEFENTDEDLDELSFEYLNRHRNLFRESKHQPPKEQRDSQAYGRDDLIIPHGKL